MLSWIKKLFGIDPNAPQITQVIDVVSDTIVRLNVGNIDGVQEGDRFQIVGSMTASTAPELITKDTKIPEHVRGIVQVSSVQEDECSATTIKDDSGELKHLLHAQVGDLAKKF